MRISLRKVLATLFVASCAGAAAPPVARADQPRTVVVSIDAPDDVELEVQHGTAWTKVCDAPCNRPLPDGENYRINGSGIRASKPFRLQPGTSTRLEVDPTSSTGHAFAIVITVTGIFGLVPVAGVTVALVGAEFVGLILICPLVDAFSSTSYSGCLGDIGTEVGQYYARPYVWIPALVGLAMVGGGGAWLASTPATGVNQTPGGSPGGAPGGAPILRAPETRRDPMLATIPASVTSPVLKLAF